MSNIHSLSSDEIERLIEPMSMEVHAPASLYNSADDLYPSPAAFFFVMITFSVVSRYFETLPDVLAIS